MFLTISLTSLLVPTPFTKGGGGGGGRGLARPPAISKTVDPMNVKFCRDIFERPRNVKVVYIVITWLP